MSFLTTDIFTSIDKISCCNQSIAVIDYGLNYGSLGLLMTMFVTGIVGSFTHCIGMCGPIAISQMSMRLMNLPKEKMTQKNKVLCAASIPYYIGKSFSYALLAMSWFGLATVTSQSHFIKILGAILMLIAALFFMTSAFAGNPRIASNWNRLKIMRSFSNKLVAIAQSFTHNPFGFKGWVLGLLLGLIPCGLVYASIATAVSYSNNFLLAGLSLFIFGLGTIPGLFLIAYSGGKYINKVE
ncbi:MAG: hypothetical protein IRD7MM_06245 [Candidatus Midichloria mitochondrii]|nr:sulfite exporter TauE/SafE family protein [Candidatus Midichloria mitochondrii]